MFFHKVFYNIILTICFIFGSFILWNTASCKQNYKYHYQKYSFHNKIPPLNQLLISYFKIISTLDFLFIKYNPFFTTSHFKLPFIKNNVPLNGLPTQEQ